MPTKTRTVKNKQSTRVKKPGKTKAQASSPPSQADVLGPVAPGRAGKGGVVRLTSHKARSRWFQTRAAWPVREASVNRLIRERTRAEKSLAAPRDITAEWECVGPTNIGGRITSLACHPDHPER